MSDELVTLKSELRERTDLLFSYALKAKELEAQLAECRKIRNDYSMGVDPIEYNEMCYKTAGMHDRLVEVEEQLAAAQAQVAAVTEQRDAAIEAVMGEDYVFGQYEIEDTPTLYEIISDQVEAEKAHARAELQAEMQAMVANLTALADEWREEDCYDKGRRETLDWCADRLREAIGGEVK